MASLLGALLLVFMFPVQVQEFCLLVFELSLVLGLFSFNLSNLSLR